MALEAKLQRAYADAGGCGKRREIERLAGGCFEIFRARCKVCGSVSAWPWNVRMASDHPWRCPVRRLSSRLSSQLAAASGDRLRFGPTPSARLARASICVRSACAAGVERSTTGSNSTARAGLPASAAARCSSTLRSTRRISWAQSFQLIRVGTVGDSSEAATPGALAIARAPVSIRAEPRSGSCTRMKRSRQPGSIDTDPP